MPRLIVEREGPIATIRISNPAKYNAMTLTMWRALPQELQALDADESVRVIILDSVIAIAQVRAPCTAGSSQRATCSPRHSSSGS